MSLERRVVLLASLACGLLAVRAPAQTCPAPSAQPLVALPSAFLDEVSGLLFDGQSLVSLHPEFLAASVNPNLILSDEATVDVSFIDEGATNRNAFGYFLFDESNNVLCAQSLWPDVSEASQANPSGILVPGETLRLGTFPAGSRIGFYLIADGANRGQTVPSDAQPQNVFYTVDVLNTDGFRHAALIAPEATVNGKQVLVLSFEDELNLEDADYNDVVFIVNLISADDPTGGGGGGDGTGGGGGSGPDDPTTDDTIDNGNIPRAGAVDDDDGDGVLNDDDDFPNDAERAFSVRSPSVDSDFCINFDIPTAQASDDVLVGFAIERIFDGTGRIREIIVTSDTDGAAIASVGSFHIKLTFAGFGASSVLDKFDADGLLQSSSPASHSGDVDTMLLDGSTRSARLRITFDQAILPSQLDAVPFSPYFFDTDANDNVTPPGLSAD